MLNALSILVGLIAAFLAIFAFLPFLGWAYWLIVPIALVGLLLGVLSSSTSGRNLNIFVVIVGIVRLMLGGGII